MNIKLMCQVSLNRPLGKRDRHHAKSVLTDGRLTRKHTRLSPPRWHKNRWAGKSEKWS